MPIKKTIIILPCNGDCGAGRITWLAAQELVLAGKARWYSAQLLAAEAAANPVQEPPFILVDGCDRQCLFTTFLDKGLVGRHHLALSDVGIEPLSSNDISREEIELAKDAVIAECTPVDPLRPPRLPGCCCR